MENRSELKIFNALDLKIMAMVFMLCDHLWATVIPGGAWLNDIGRLAFPIFAFQIVEGYFCTSDYKKYIRRIFFFALLSEIPYNLMTGGSVINPFGQNVLFTFCIGLLLIRAMDRAGEKNRWLGLAAGILCIAGGYLLGTLTFVDYHGAGVLMVLLFYLCRGRKYGWIFLIAGMLYLNTEMIGGKMYTLTLLGRSFSFYQQGIAVLALIPIFLYNGRQGPHGRRIQLACYLFYPVHMLILSLIWLCGLQG